MSFDLTNYILSSRKKGLTDQQIKESFKNAGWNDKQIHQVFDNQFFNVPPPPSNSRQAEDTDLKGSLSMWDAFEHVIMFISLYFMATGISIILHYIVDYYFSKISEFGASTIFYDYFLLSAQAAVIVSSPLFIFFHLHVAKRTLEKPIIKQLRARKSLIYLTLIGTFLIMLGNLIYTVYTFLKGNITLNFTLNLLVTLFLAGSIFTYYLTLVKFDQKADV